MSDITKLTVRLDGPEGPILSVNGRVAWTLMRRDEEKAQRDKANGQKGGNPNILGITEGVNPPDNPEDNEGDKAKNIEYRSKKEEEHARASREAFEQFRKAYPRRDGTQDWRKAREVFDRALKTGVDPKVIIGGAKRYLAECQRKGIVGTSYVKQARSWMNGRVWEEYQAAPAGGSSSAGADAAIDWRGLVRNFRSSGNWPSSIGPGPDQSGCRAPPEILAEFGLPAGGEARGNTG